MSQKFPTQATYLYCSAYIDSVLLSVEE